MVSAMYVGDFGEYNGKEVISRNECDFADLAVNIVELSVNWLGVGAQLDVEKGVVERVVVVEATRTETFS